MSYAGTAYAPMFSPGRGFQVPSPADAARRFGGALADLSKSAGRFAPSAAQMRTAYRLGSRLAPGGLAFVLAVEAGFFLYDLTKAYGPKVMDLRGTGWTNNNPCGNPQHDLTNGAWPGTDCSLVLPYAQTRNPHLNVYNVAERVGTYPINFSTTGRRAGQISRVGSFQKGRVAAAIAHPVAEYPWAPLFSALAPNLYPANVPRRDPVAIPYPLLPQVRPNRGLPGPVQLQSFYDIPRVDPVTEYFPATPPVVEGVTDPGSPPIPDIVVHPVPVGLPVAEPNHPLVISPAAPIPVATPFMPHDRRPPGPKEKEIKPGGRKGPAALALRVMNGLSEVEDLVDALYWAVDLGYTGRIVDGRKEYLRNRLKGRKVWWKDRVGNWHSRFVHDHTLQEKINWLYENFPGLDTVQALKNLVKNEIGDQAHGRIGRVAGMATRAAYRTGVVTPHSAPVLSRRSGVNPSPGLPLKDVYDSVDRVIDYAYSEGSYQLNAEANRVRNDPSRSAPLQLLRKGVAVAPMVGAYLNRASDIYVKAYLKEVYGVEIR